MLKRQITWLIGVVFMMRCQIYLVIYGKKKMNNTPFLPAIDDDVRHVIGIFQDEIADAHFHIGQRFLRAKREVVF